MNSSALTLIFNDTTNAILRLKNDEELVPSEIEIEYLAIKNILIRTIPKAVKSNKLKVKNLTIEIRQSVKFLNSHFPNWSINPIFNDKNNRYLIIRLESLKV